MLTHKKTFPSALRAFGRAGAELPAQTRALLDMDVLAGRHQGPCWHVELSGAQKGGDSSGSSQLDRSPGWVPVPAFPAPGAPQEMHFTATSSRGTLLLPALPEGNCVTLEGSGGANPSPSPPAPLPARPNLESSQAPHRDLDWLCFAILGFAPWPGTIPIPEKAHFSVLSCPFVPA